MDRKSGAGPRAKSRDPIIVVVRGGLVHVIAAPALHRPGAAATAHAGPARRPVVVVVFASTVHPGGGVGRGRRAPRVGRLAIRMSASHGRMSRDDGTLLAYVYVVQRLMRVCVRRAVSLPL